MNLLCSVEGHPMWQQYRKTLIPTQLFILTMCGIMLYKQVPVPGVLLVFAVMQIGAVLGAMWAVRLRRKVLASKNDLPLRPR
jgi:hypothetical protein